MTDSVLFCVFLAEKKKVDDVTSWLLSQWYCMVVKI